MKITPSKKKFKNSEDLGEICFPNFHSKLKFDKNKFSMGFIISHDFLVSFSGKNISSEHEDKKKAISEHFKIKLGLRGRKGKYILL